VSEAMTVAKAAAGVQAWRDAITIDAAREQAAIRPLLAGRCRMANALIRQNDDSKLPVMLRKSRLPTFEVSGREKGAACSPYARPKGYARWRLNSSLALRKSGGL
jgi:hypothetical protein